jgi:hypothetical protein
MNLDCADEYGPTDSERRGNQRSQQWSAAKFGRTAKTEIRNICQISSSIYSNIPEPTANATPGLPEYRYAINTLANQRKQGCRPLSGDLMVNLWSRAQLPEQVLLWTFVRPSREPLEALSYAPHPRKESIMIDLATISAAIGAATAGVQLIDKIRDQVSRFLTKDPELVTPAQTEHRAKIERDGDSIVQKRYGSEYQRITASDLQKLPESDLQHIKVYEQAMENHYAIWASVYPGLALAIDPIAKARTEMQLKAIISAMKGDLLAILNFLRNSGLELDDHYSKFYDVVSKA